ncbi:hypothetical protein [Methylobacterium oxalidis]|nr:hypothetical protein [Methylobacterium oxalidis]
MSILSRVRAARRDVSVRHGHGLAAPGPDEAGSGATAGGGVAERR